MRGWTVARVSGIPLQLHFSLPIGILLFGGLHVRPIFWLAALFVIVIHELGHAAMVRITGHHVTRIVLHGAGGLCFWTGDATKIARAQIAWGGVLAQLLILAPAYLVGTVWGDELPPWSGEVSYAFVRMNLWLIAINLIPAPRFDGYEAWPLFRLLLERRRARAKKRVAARTRETHALMQQLDAAETATPPADVEAVVADVFERAKKKR
jgi:Zn-dependent protease